MFAYCKNSAASYVDFSGERLAATYWYSKYLYEEIRNREINDSHESHWGMSENHIYSEMYVHLYGWFKFKIDKAEIADLNVDESRPYVVAAMRFFGGYNGKEEFR